MKHYSQRVLDALLERFILDANHKHSNKYDYSEVKILSSTDKICIICPDHGKFYQTKASHLKCDLACPQCYLVAHPPKTPYVKKIKPILPSETINGVTKWIKQCPTCENTMKYKDQKKLRSSLREKRICRTCFHNKRRTYFIGSGPWIRSCIECGNQVTINKKQTFINTIRKSIKCRCEPCFKKWIKVHNSIISTLNFNKSNKPGYKLRPFVFPDGRVEMVQGFEPLTLNYLISQSISPIEIRTKYHEKPIIQYDYLGNKKHYIPDAFISGSNTIVETKSTWTWKCALDQNLAKIKASTGYGYNMRIVIWGGGDKKKRKLISDSFYPAHINVLPVYAS